MVYAKIYIGSSNIPKRDRKAKNMDERNIDNNERIDTGEGVASHGIVITDGEGKKHTLSFGGWCEHIWYHYKWHILISLFVLLVSVVGITQCVGKKADPTDLHILYAGGSQISSATDSKDKDAPFNDIEKTLTSLCPDYDKNGNVLVDLESYYYLSSGELAELKADNDKRPENEKIDYLYYENVVKYNKNTLNSLMLSSEYYVWFISESLYNEYLNTSSGELRFVSLEGFGKDGRTLPYYIDKSGNVDYKAVYLKDLMLYDYSGIDNMPDDTLVVLRTPTVSERHDLTEYNKSLDFIKKLLNL